MDRIIGLDLGSKTCGVSICDALHITCRALTTVRFESDDYDACSILLFIPGRLK